MKRTALKRGAPLRRTKPLRSRIGSDADAQRFRSAVLLRAHNHCERCGAPGHLHAHHMLPRSRGGKHTVANGAALCGACHGAVHDHTADDWRGWVVAR